MRLFILLLTLPLLGGCLAPSLSCRSEYLYPNYLASEQIDTPDLLRGCYYGQQLLVHWRVPRSCLPITLLLKVRYGNREVEIYKEELTKSRGWRIHRLINQEYWERGGILSFQAQLIREERVIASWTHSLWAEIIEVCSED